MKIFTLYIAVDKPGAKEIVQSLLSEGFPSFTFIEGKGFFRGDLESMLFVKVATTDWRRVIRVAENLRSTLQQDSVGIEYENMYYKCTATDSAGDLAKRLDSESPL